MYALIRITGEGAKIFLTTISLQRQTENINPGWMATEMEWLVNCNFSKLPKTRHEISILKDMQTGDHFKVLVRGIMSIPFLAARSLGCTTNGENDLFGQNI